MDGMGKDTCPQYQVTLTNQGLKVENFQYKDLKCYHQTFEVPKWRYETPI